MGYRVALIARGIEPNRPDLQSVSPGVLTLVDAIGLNTQMIHACLTPIQCARKCWDGFDDERLHPPGFLVHRHIFDNDLLTAAKQLGVPVIQPASLTGWRFINEKWELQLSQGGASSKLIAKFLVDATGKKSVFPGKKPAAGKTDPVRRHLHNWNQQPLTGSGVLRNPKIFFM
jgi:flavin-dependent dehydrogenase